MKTSVAKRCRGKREYLPLRRFTNLRNVERRSTVSIGGRQRQALKLGLLIAQSPTLLRLLRDYAILNHRFGNVAALEKPCSYLLKNVRTGRTGKKRSLPRS